MKKFHLAVLLVFILTLLLAPAALAEEMPPIAGCPRGGNWELMMMHPHDGDDHEHMHHHIGNDFDQNGDGWVCMFTAGNDNHVHIDNVVPFN